MAEISAQFPYYEDSDCESDEESIECDDAVYLGKIFSLPTAEKPGLIASDGIDDLPENIPAPVLPFLKEDVQIDLEEGDIVKYIVMQHQDTGECAAFDIELVQKRQDIENKHIQRELSKGGERIEGIVKSIDQESGKGIITVNRQFMVSFNLSSEVEKEGINNNNINADDDDNDNVEIKEGSEVSFIAVDNPHNPFHIERCMAVKIKLLPKGTVLKTEVVIDIAMGRVLEVDETGKTGNLEVELSDKRARELGFVTHVSKWRPLKPVCEADDVVYDLLGFDAQSLSCEDTVLAVGDEVRLKITQRKDLGTFFTKDIEVYAYNPEVRKEGVISTVVRDFGYIQATNGESYFFFADRVIPMPGNGTIPLRYSERTSFPAPCIEMKPSPLGTKATSQIPVANLKRGMEVSFIVTTNMDHGEEKEIGSDIILLPAGSLPNRQSLLSTSDAANKQRKRKGSFRRSRSNSKTSPSLNPNPCLSSSLTKLSISAAEFRPSPSPQTGFIMSGTVIRNDSQIKDSSFDIPPSRRRTSHSHETKTTNSSIPPSEADSDNNWRKSKKKATTTGPSFAAFSSYSASYQNSINREASKALKAGGTPISKSTTIAASSKAKGKYKRVTIQQLHRTSKDFKSTKGNLNTKTWRRKS